MSASCVCVCRALWFVMEPMKRALMIAAACAPLLAGCATGGPRAPDTTLPAAFEAPSRGAALPAAALDQW